MFESPFIIYFSGMLSVIWVYYLRKWYKQWRAKRKEELFTIIGAEKNGWMRAKSISNHEYWRDKSHLIKWRKEISKDLDIEEWIKENIKGSFRTTYISGYKYIRFDNEEDGVAFKLRWE